MNEIEDHYHDHPVIEFTWDSTVSGKQNGLFNTEQYLYEDPRLCACEPV